MLLLPSLQLFIVISTQIYESKYKLKTNLMKSLIKLDCLYI